MQHWRERLLSDGGIAPTPHEFLNGRLRLVARDVSRVPAAGSLLSPALRRALHDRFKEPLDLAGITAEPHVHPVTLARQFKQAYGATIGACLRQLRVAFVGRRPATPASQADLALQAGFYDQPT